MNKGHRFFGREGSKGAPAAAELQTEQPDEPPGAGRRVFLGKLGMVAVGVSLGLPAALSVRSLVPNMLYEQPQRVKLGPLDLFTDGSTFFPAQRIFIFRDKNTFHCMSASCTHLGCTVQLAKLEADEPGVDFEFRCPCHGSKFHYDGMNYAGPAPSPLHAFQLELAAEDGSLVVDMSKTVGRDWRFTV
jgi:cytochrome b6-f complex iron-sulfur subunit